MVVLHIQGSQRLLLLLVGEVRVRRHATTLALCFGLCPLEHWNIDQVDVSAGPTVVVKWTTLSFRRNPNTLKTENRIQSLPS